MDPVTVKIDTSGRLVVPKEMRDELGLSEGGTLVLSVENGVLRGTTRLGALRRIQAEFRASVPSGVSMTDELIADRRAEARREFAEMQAPLLSDKDG